MSRTDCSMPIRKLLIASILLLASVASAEERSLFDTRNRFLDGSIDTRNARLVPSTTIIDSFEDGKAIAANWQFKNLDQSQDDAHATHGNKSLKLTFKDPSSLAGYRRGLDGWGGGNDGPLLDELSAWSSLIIHNDEFRLDIFNPQDREVTLAVKFGIPSTFKLKPGKNEIAMKTRDVIDSAYRSSSILQNTNFSVTDSTGATLYFDNMRWIGPGIGENLLKFGRCFDCGTDLPNYLRPYFQPLTQSTAYDKQTGFGWEGSLTRISERIHATSGSSGRQPIDLLLRDSLRNISHPLLVDLPDGKYRVQWVEGESFAYYNVNMPMDYDLAVKANGVTTPIRRGAKTFDERIGYIYGRDRVDYMPNQDKWNAFMTAWFTPMECDVTVTGGQLHLEFATTPPNRGNAAFILIYPVDKADVIEPEIALLWQDIRYRFNVMSFQQPTLEMAKQMNLPGLHDEMLDPAAARQREAALAALPAAKDGLLVFNRPPADDVFPDTVPQQSELATSLSAAGSPGEISSLAINLHALKDLHQLKVTLDDFTSSTGKEIPRNVVNLRFVRYSYRVTGQQTHGDWKYLVIPWFLVDRDSIEMSKGMSTRWWLNVDLPKDTAPGAYTATATIESADTAPLKVSLSLTVLPIRLDPVPSTTEFGTFYYAWGPHAIEPDVWSYFTTQNYSDNDANRVKKELREQRQKRINAEFSLMNRYGINTVYFDRLSSYDGARNEPSAEALQGIRLLPITDQNKRTYLHLLESLNEQTLAKSKTPGQTSLLGRYSPDVANDQEEPNIYRFCSGPLLWRMNANGCFYEVWRDSFGDPYHPFDYHCGEMGDLAAPASHNWPTLNSSVVLEGIREGILDYRYFITLEHLLREHPDHPATARAKTLLQSLHDRIKPDGRQYFVGVGGRNWDDTWHQKDTAWKAADYLETRAQLAALIAELQTP